MKPQFLIPVFMLLLVSLACSIPFSAATTATPILTPTPAPTAFVLPPTITVCPFVENPGPPPPELIKRAQDAFAAFGFKGDLKVTGEGEYTCAEFHLRSVSFEFTLDVANLKDVAMMKALADKLKVYPVKQVLGNTNFGDIKVRFRAWKEFCWWDDAQGCGPAMPLP